MQQTEKLFFTMLFCFFVCAVAKPSLAGCIGNTTSTNFQCGSTITESCTMNENITTNLYDCFTVGADNIVIDGAGHSITGPWYYSNPPQPSDDKAIDLLNRSGVTIKNLTINNFYWGISAYNGTSCLLDKNTISNAYFPIELRGDSSGNTVSNNTITDSLFGIKLAWGGSLTGNTIIGNTITNCSNRAIYLTEGADNNTIKSNTVSGNGDHGITLVRAIKNIIEGNTVSNNHLDGIHLVESHGTTVKYNHITGHTYSGIELADTENSTIQFNRIADNLESGVHFFADAVANTLISNQVCYSPGVSPSQFHIWDETPTGTTGNSNTCGTASGFTDTDATASGCAFSCGCGCVADSTTFQCGDTVTASCVMNCNLLAAGNCFQVNSNNISIDGKGHTIYGNGSGNAVRADETHGVVVRNLVIGNFDKGVYLYHDRFETLKSSGDNQVINTKITKAKDAIFLQDSKNNTLTQNTAKDNEDGIALRNNSTGNTLAKNIIARSSGNGLSFLATATSNTLTGNTSCASGIQDINNSGGSSNTGSSTTCTTTGTTYNDVDKTGCTYACPICSDGTFFGECSLTAPKYCNEGTLVNDCGRCGCAEGNCNPTTGLCQAEPPPRGKCVGATKQFSCGEEVTESCTLNGHMVSEGTCFSVTRNNVTIDGAGFSITGNQTGNGIDTMVHDNLTIRNIELKRFYTGINLYYSNASLIEHNTISDCEFNGIVLRTETQNTIVRNNTLTLNDVAGIRIDDARSNTISNNTFQKNASGLRLINESDSNTFTNNTVTESNFWGMRLNNSDGNTITGNYFAHNGWEGLGMFNSSNNNTIQSNSIRHNLVFGLLVSESTGNALADNFITDHENDGVIFDALSSANQLTGNTICNNGDATAYFDIENEGSVSNVSGSNNSCTSVHNFKDNGMASGCANACNVHGCDAGSEVYQCGDTITQNCQLTGTITSEGSCFTVGGNNITIDGKGFGIIGTKQLNSRGIQAIGRDNLTLTNLQIRDFYEGITFENVTNSDITANTINDNVYGINLLSSSNNQIANNTIKRNDHDGIKLAFSTSTGNQISDNLIEDNDFGIRLLFSADNNTLQNNNIVNSQDYGIYLDFDTNGNQLNANSSCGGAVDIYQDGTNTGDNNRCDTVHTWNDSGTSGCTDSCSGKNLADTISYLQILAGLESSLPVSLSLDINGDGKIGLAEIINNLKVLAE